MGILVWEKHLYTFLNSNNVQDIRSEKNDLIKAEPNESYLYQASDYF